MATFYTNKDHTEVLASPLALKCFANNKIEIIQLSLKKEEEIPTHKNPVDVLFYVKSGKGTLTVDEKKIELQENELAYITLSEDRSWINPNEETLELLVIKMIK